MPAYWIDTDPGLDDALAILLALREVGPALVGLSTVQGNVDEPTAARNLARLLAIYRERGIAPGGWAPTLVRGSQIPLASERFRRAHSVHGQDGLGGVQWPTPAEADWGGYAETPAAMAIVQAARRHPDLHLVCIGPLTNLALALRLDADLPHRLAGLTIMGGSLRAGGNDTLAAEFNFLADAEAAKLVLAAGLPHVSLVPMDGCLTARMGAAEWDRLCALDTPAARTSREIVGSWEVRIRAEGAALYDPLAWLATSQPDLMRWQDLYVAVDAGQDVAHGASLADWRGRSGKPPNVRVAMEAANPTAVFDTLFATLGERTTR